MRVFTAVFFLIISQCAFAQEGDKNRPKGKVKILGPIENVQFKKINGKRARIMVGNVAFQKDEVIFKCDSAIQFIEDEITYAYRNVKFNQGDSLRLTGDEMVFDDKTEMAIISGKTVRMTDGKMTLTTTKLYYNMANDVGYYLDSAFIEDGQNELHSKKGYYYSKSHSLFFKTRVRLNNPEYKIATDTLQYNVQTEDAFFYGPTDILSHTGDVLYCERGKFYTKRNYAQMGKNTRIETEGRVLYGDSLTYRSNTGIGEAYKRVKLVDTAQNLSVAGNKGWYSRIESSFMVTDSVLFSQFQEDDTLHLTADTLRMFTDTVDSARVMLAYYKVRIYSRDYQADCDSLFYGTTDSVMHFTGSPIFWMSDFQVKSDFIKAWLKDNELHKVHLQDNSIMGRFIDDKHFDQIGSDSMDAFFKDGKLKKIDAFGSPQAIYFARDDNDSSFIGGNKTKGSKATIWFKEGEIAKLNFSQNGTANMLPPIDFDNHDLMLPSFIWHAGLRPNSIAELFIKQKSAAEIGGVLNSTSQP